MDSPPSLTAISPSGPGSIIAPHSFNTSPHSAVRNQANPPQHEGRHADSPSNRTVGPEDTHGLSSDRNREPIGDQTPRDRPIKTETTESSHEYEMLAQRRPMMSNNERQGHTGQSSRPPTQTRHEMNSAEAQAGGTRPTVGYGEYRDVQVSMRSIVTRSMYRQTSASGSGHRAMPQQVNVSPTQALGGATENHSHRTNVTIRVNSQPLPTQNGLAPIQISADPSGVANGRPLNNVLHSSEAHQQPTPLLNASLLPQHSGGARPLPYDHLINEGFPSPLAHPPTTPHVLPMGEPYESNYITARSRPRNGPPGAISFRGVSQGGMLLWNVKDRDRPVARLPVTEAEKAVVYDHLIHSARWMAQTAPDRHIWVETLRRLEMAAMALEGRYDESEVIRL